MAKWGVRSMVWYILILVLAFCVSLFYYLKFINDPTIQNILY